MTCCRLSVLFATVAVACSSADGLESLDDELAGERDVAGITPPTKYPKDCGWWCSGYPDNQPEYNSGSGCDEQFCIPDDPEEVCTGYPQYITGECAMCGTLVPAEG